MNEANPLTPKPYSELLVNVEPWELVAPGYAAEAALVMEPFSLEALEFFALASDARVIDVAAGPGTLSLPLARRVREVVAVDFAAPMLAELERAAAAERISNVRAVNADGQALPFEDAEFDAGFSLFGLMFFPDRARGLAELFRVLRPGGSVVISTWAPMEDSSLFQLLLGALRAADPSVPAPRRDPAGFENPAVMEAELAAAGFRDVAVHAREKVFTASDARRFWDNITRANAPLVMMRHRLGETEWQKRSEVALEYLKERFRDGALELGTTALYAVGRKP